jgi:Na+/H+ antiporter NhaD/arsenite permease-like protein
LPRVNIDRPSAAFTGAVLMVICGVLTFEQAVGAIDFNTITLLLGMMVLVSVLQQSGLFTLLAVKSVRIASNPRRLMGVVIIATAVCSAFMVNDAVVLFFTPIILQTCRLVKIRPVPFLVAEAMASNIGSTATVVGNPQNMLIGIRSGIGFLDFFLYLLPVALVSLGILAAVLFLFYRKDLRGEFASGGEVLPKTGIYDLDAIKRAVPVLVLTLVAFFLSTTFQLPISIIALAGAALVMLTSKLNPTQVIKGVDWVLLVFFAGLFIVIGGAHQAGVLNAALDKITITPDLPGILSISAFSLAVSQVVSNVPLTMLVIPAIQNVPGDVLWIALAAGATLGGNLTIIGAVANIIVVEGAAREGVTVRFREFLKAGAVVSILTVAAGALIIAGEQWLGWLR